MKSKTGPSFSSDFKSPHLFIEDLEKIERIFKEDVKPRTYEIDTSNFKCDSVHDLSKDDGVLNRLKFSSYSPNIYVDFSEYGARVTSYDHSLVAIGGAEKISEIIHKRERKVLWFLFNRFIYVGWITGLTMWSIPKGNTFILIIYLLIFIVLLAIIIGRFTNLYKESKIELIPISDSKNFFERNKDQIAVNLITGSIGAILGVLATIIAFRFKLLK